MKAKYFFPGLIAVLALGFVLVQNSEAPVRYEDEMEEETPMPESTYPAWMTTFVTPDPSIPSADVTTFVCETIERKPSTLTSTCADFGIAIYEIKWKTWAATGAYGTGLYSVNDCEPSCAEGKRHEQPVSIQLKDLVTDGKKYYLSTALISQLDPTKESIGVQEWDLVEFYREMWAYENE